MFKTIIWATDGSETASHALAAALALAGEGDGRLVVAHVRELMVGKGGGYPVYADEPDLTEQLEQQVEELRSSGVDVTFEQRTCLSGRIGTTIAEIAREANGDVIVVGTRGHTRLGQLFIGSVTQQLLRVGGYPVLAIPAVSVPAAV
jgi:nucleotide-binding universal stress UspA family protein